MTCFFEKIFNVHVLDVVYRQSENQMIRFREPAILWKNPAFVNFSHKFDTGL